MAGIILLFSATDDISSSLLGDCKAQYFKLLWKEFNAILNRLCTSSSFMVWQLEQSDAFQLSAEFM